MMGELNALREDVHSVFLDFHFKAIALTSAEEWDPIIKEINKAVL
jgi:hypothetical protein